MSDQDDLLDLDENNNEDITRKDNRIKSLSEKVKTASEERDALAKAKEEEAQARAIAEKERNFYKDFNQTTAKYPGASEYQDQILEKVNAGYDVEDATISILAKEGKYTQPEVQEELGKVAGGSASVGINDTVEKTADKMTQDERRSILQDMEAKGEFKL